MMVVIPVKGFPGYMISDTGFKMKRKQYEISRILGIRKHLVFQVVHGKSWRHIII